MTPDAPRYNVLLVRIDQMPGGPDAAAERIAERFSLPAKIAHRLVNAVPTPVKKDVELSVAVRYVEALEALGAHAQLVASDAEQLGPSGAAASTGVLRRPNERPGRATDSNAVPQTSGSYMAIRRPADGARDEPTGEDLLAVSSSPVVAEISDPAIDVPEATQMLDPDRLARAGVSLEQHAARLVDAGADFAQLRKRQRPDVQREAEASSDLGFSSDLAAFVDGTEERHPFSMPGGVRAGTGGSVEVADEDNPFALPPQVTGSHNVVPARDDSPSPGTGAADPSDSDAIGGFLGDFAGELADEASGGSARIDSVQALGDDLGMGAARPSLFDELQSISESDDDDGFGADISSSPPEPLRRRDVPTNDPAEGIAYPAGAAVPGLSTRDTLEDQLMHLTDSYRAIESGDAGSYEDPEMDASSLDTVAPRAAAARASGSGASPATRQTGQERATTPSGTYIASTGSFKPAPRRPVWVTLVFSLALLGGVAAAGYYGYEAWRTRQPEVVFAEATDYYEFTEQLADETARYVCASVGRRRFLCQYGRGFYRAQFPDASGPALEAAVERCYAELTTSGLGLSENLTCRVRVDRGGQMQRHDFSYLRDVDCSSNLLQLEEGATTNCTTRVELLHQIDGAEQRQAELGGDELYQLRRAIQLDTEVGYLDTLEFVVTRENNVTQRAFFYEPLAMFVRRRGFAGEELQDIVYMVGPERTGGQSELLRR